MKVRYTGGRSLPPSFFDPLTGRDREIIDRQMKARRFDSSLALGAARRCSFGVPSVLLCGPLRKGRPFPTTFWLTCPHLVRLCGRKEAKGGVGLLDRLLEEKAAQWRGWNLLHARFRLSLLSPTERAFLSSRRPALWNSLRRGGAGGIDLRRGGGAKCLHLQAASWLALGFHPGEEILKELLVPLECSSPPINGCVLSAGEDESTEKRS